MPRWGGRVRGSPDRGAAPALAALACAAAACAAQPAPPGDLAGSLTADRTRVAEGGEVRLALTVTARGSAMGRKPALPALPPLKRFELLSAGQRNEAAYAADGGSRSVSFLYALRAKSEGTESIPPVEILGEDEKGEKGALLTVPGITLTVEPAGRAVFRWGIAVCVAAFAAAAALAASIPRRKRRRAAPPPPPVPPGTRRRDDAAGALAAIEEARPLMLSGDWGEYAARVHRALAGFAGRGGGPQIADLAESAGERLERVRYARDPEAERAILESVRKAEIILRKMMREE